MNPFSYLAASSPEIVRIEENGEVWVWKNNDSTAAFAEQLAEILEKTSQLLNGIPPITSILCVASVFRHWESDGVWIDRLRGLIFADDEAKQAFENALPRLVHWLNKLGSQNEQLKSGTLATVAVFGCGLFNRPDLLEVVDKQQIANIIETLRLPREDRPLSSSMYVLSDEQFQAHCMLTWKTLLHLAESLEDPNIVHTWLNTGLHEVPQTVEDPQLPAPQSLQETLASLEKDDIYGGLARYSRNLSSLISLPRRPTDPDDLPQGGVSDVSNRGTPERLLMTELAADPLVLLARIANGQALYMRKESPPGVKANARPVLIESSIHCWGMTRVRMAAFAMAVATAERRRANLDTEFYLLDGDEYHAVDVSSQDGVLELIERLEAADCPTDSVAKFVREHGDRLAEKNDLAEPLLIISGATLRNSYFQKTLTELKQTFLIASVERDGVVTIVRRSAMGDERLQSLRLELTSEHLRPTLRHGGSKPLFTTLTIPTLAFSPAGREVDWIAEERVDGQSTVWLISQDQRLLRFTSPMHGGEEIIDSVPAGKVHFSVAEGDRVEFVLRQEQCDRLVIIDAQALTLTSRVLGIQGVDVTYAVAGQYLLRFNHGLCQVFDRCSGEKLTNYDTKRRHVGFCYQVDEDGWVWKHGGGAPHDWHKLGRVTFPGNQTVGGVLESRDGIWAVSDSLTAMIRLPTPDTLTSSSTPSPSILEIPSRSSLASRSTLTALHHAFPIAENRGKRRCVFQVIELPIASQANRKSELAHYRLDLEAREPVRLPSTHSSDLVRSLYPSAYQLVRRKPLRRRTRAVAISSDAIIFEKEHGVYFQLSLAYNHPQRLKVSPSSSSQRESFAKLTFAAFGEPVKQENDPNRFWTLREAKLIGGTCWADSRGLFHFQRDDDPNELTPALADAHVAGWFSASGVFGPKYFFPHSSQQHAEIPLPDAVANWLKQWFQKAT